MIGKHFSHVHDLLGILKPLRRGGLRPIAWLEAIGPFAKTSCFAACLLPLKKEEDGETETDDADGNEDSPETFLPNILLASRHLKSFKRSTKTALHGALCVSLGDFQGETDQGEDQQGHCDLRKHTRDLYLPL